ncbi:MAG: hypothetical protein WC162_06885 [Sphaerochaetaceae bacterium]
MEKDKLEEKAKNQEILEAFDTIKTLRSGLKKNLKLLRPAVISPSFFKMAKQILIVSFILFALVFYKDSTNDNSFLIDALFVIGILFILIFTIIQKIRITKDTLGNKLITIAILGSSKKLIEMLVCFIICFVGVFFYAKNNGVYWIIVPFVFSMLGIETIEIASYLDLKYFNLEGFAMLVGGAIMLIFYNGTFLLTWIMGIWLIYLLVTIVSLELENSAK